MSLPPPTDSRDDRSPGQPHDRVNDQHDRNVVQRLNQLRATATAQHLLRAERRPPMPPLLRLDRFLAEHDGPIDWRIDGILPVGATVLLAAARKAGKTTLRDNLIRSYADGDPFLGRKVTRPGVVVVLDVEMDRRMLRRWLRDQDIVNPERVRVMTLKGAVGALDLTDPDCCRDWAAELAKWEADVVILDCLRPVLDALGLSENSDAGRFLVGWDRMIEQAGAGESVVIHHMGHGQERARGDSALRAWPAVEWRLLRNKEEDDESPRYFAAYGRDVNLPQSRVVFDPDTRRFDMDGGTRAEARAQVHIPALLAIMVERETYGERAWSGRSLDGWLHDSVAPARRRSCGCLRSRRRRGARGRARRFGRAAGRSRWCRC
jgi:AAA domain